MLTMWQCLGASVVLGVWTLLQVARDHARHELVELDAAARVALRSPDA